CAEREPPRHGTLHTAAFGCHLAVGIGEWAVCWRRRQARGKLRLRWQPFLPWLFFPWWLLAIGIRCFANSALLGQPAGKPQATNVERQVQRIRLIAKLYLHYAEAMDLCRAEAPVEQVQALNTRGRFLLVTLGTRNVFGVHLRPPCPCSRRGLPPLDTAPFWAWRLPEEARSFSLDPLGYTIM